MATKEELVEQDDWPLVDAYYLKFALSCQLSEDGRSTKLQVSFNLDMKSFSYTSQEEALRIVDAEEHSKEVFCQSNNAFLPPKPDSVHKEKISFLSEGVTHLLLETASSAKPSASSAAENVNSHETTPSEQEGKKRFVLVRVNYKNFEPDKSSPSVLNVWQDMDKNKGTRLIPVFLLEVLFFLGRAKKRFMSS